MAAASSAPALVLWSAMAMTFRSVRAHTHLKTSSGDATPSDAVVWMWRSAADQLWFAMAGDMVPNGTGVR